MNIEVVAEHQLHSLKVNNQHIWAFDTDKDAQDAAANLRLAMEVLGVAAQGSNATFIFEALTQGLDDDKADYEDERLDDNTLKLSFDDGDVLLVKVEEAPHAG